MLVKLCYFKPSGKYYSEGEYETAITAVDLVHPDGAHAPPIHLIFSEVHELKTKQMLPGLIEGHSDFAVLIDVPDHPHRHPHLIPGSES